MRGRFAILGSGSKGNCAYLEVDGHAVLIDAGLSAKQIIERLEPLGCGLAQVEAVLLTHEHTDHIRGLEVLCQRHPIPVFCNRDTAYGIPERLRQKLTIRLFETGWAFSCGPIRCESFPVPHDAMDPVGFSIQAGGMTIVWLTDLGHVTTLVRERARRSNILVLEANHDEKLLLEHPTRPWSLKQRILSRHGHLSNREAATLIQEIIHDEMQWIWLCHLSEECNRPDLAIETVTGYLQQVGYKHIERIGVALQYEPTSLMIW